MSRAEKKVTSSRILIVCVTNRDVEQLRYNQRKTSAARFVLCQKLNMILFLLT